MATGGTNQRFTAPLRVLELYSGIGGYHFALSLNSAIPFEILDAIDVNTLANDVYEHNFCSRPKSSDLARMTSDNLLKMNPSVLVMSPPCQPFTRNGNKKELEDLRSSSLAHLIEIIDKSLESPPCRDFLSYLMIENVVGFEMSAARTILVDMLGKHSFFIEEHILSPTDFGIPNSRPRYYLLKARRHDRFIGIKPVQTERECPSCTDFLSSVEFTGKEEYFLTESVIERHIGVIDIVSPLSNRTCCFTKAYGRYFKGAGSFYASKATEPTIQKEHETPRSLNEKGLRYFTAEEVAALMSFPPTFSFPTQITNKQKYRLLGNSINIRVVSILLKRLLDNGFPGEMLNEAIDENRI